MRIHPEAAKDLLAIYGRSYRADCLPELLQDIRDILPLVEQADTPKGEHDCVCVLVARARHIAFEPTIRECIRELCHYPPEARGDILDGAMALANPVADACKRLGALLPAVRACVQGLDDRTKALLVALETLRHAGSLTGTQFCDIPDQLGDTPIDDLRSEPALAVIMKAYDLAEVVITNQID